MNWANQMARKQRRRRGPFLDSYRLDDAYLLRPDKKHGVPGILSGSDANGHPILVKVWPKSDGIDDPELREIWHSEVRQLHRLAGYPKAADMIVNLQHAGEDEFGFYLVLGPGQRRPLATILEHAHSGHWLKNQRTPQHRTLLWNNFLRLCAGLETIHAQGLLHKNLNDWAILTMAGSEPDFQLTGFEWSVRLVGAAASQLPSRRRDKQSGQPASFLHDWRDFGLLVAHLMHVPIGTLADLRVPLSGVCEHMSVLEIRLLRNLIQLDHLDRLDGEIVQRRIQEILHNLEAEVANRDTKLHLVIGLGPTASLSRRIREASNNEIEVDAFEDQVNFVRDDLKGGPTIIGIKSEYTSEARIAVQGSKLIYSLNPFLPPHRGATPTWAYAHCNSCESKNPASVNVLGSASLEPNSLEIMPFHQARQRFARSRGKVRSWDTIRREFQKEAAPLGRDQRFHQALALTQLLEALYAAADAFPVEVIEGREQTQDDTVFLRVRVGDEAERDALSDALGMPAPAPRFEELLVGDHRGDDWVLTETRQVGIRAHTDTTWQFDGIERDPGTATTYRFIGTEPSLQHERPVMISGDSFGRDVQFQRRLKALRALAEHLELLWMLVDPRRRILDSHESIGQHPVFEALDASKKGAISAAIGTLPLFLIQGPPGVGKTRLVRELVRYALDNDSTARLLLTAQSNAAVDHLVETLEKDLSSSGDDILVVRCRARDRTVEEGPYEIDFKVRETIERFSGSVLVADASPSLRVVAEDLAARIREWELGESATHGREGSARFEMQAIEGLLVRAANVVFATTNSRELERLIDERGQFDWSIIEEAGKATGGELVSPLLLSYRRLMIGDHKQLSPFGSERILQLLERPEIVIEAAKLGQVFVGRTLRDPSTDEVLDEINEENADAFAELCTLAMEGLRLFECLIEGEFAQQIRNPKARPLAHRLTEQHRMHPAIAQLVSDCFYENRLKTHPTAIVRFDKGHCPVKSVDSKRLPDAPIAMIEMPYVQNTVGMRGAERNPRWHNPTEVDAVVNVVQLLRASDDSLPSLAVLSPYSEQVRRLRRRIDENVAGFPHLSGLRPAVSATSYCGTVDSFQGNEADVVIVSLVRNNQHSGPRSALGFLTDARRMNVLLSRAKWRLILVCSADFLRSVLSVTNSTNPDSDISFLSRMLHGVEEARRNGGAVVIPASRVIGGRGQ